MKTTKKIDLGEYIILINYESDDGSLDVTILDELEDVIDSITITNDEDPDNQQIDPTLN